LPWPKFHVPHALSGAFKKAGGVVEICPEEEADIHMGAEGVDVAEGGIVHARGGMAVVQELANVRPAAAHLPEPPPCEPAQRVVWLGEPRFDAGVSPSGAWETEKIAHPPVLPRMRNVSALKSTPDIASLIRATAREDTSHK
jgi:hypothetical protein